MADISTAPDAGKSRPAKPAVKRMSTRIDFTPMVDLGFLLITFFMLTTTLAKPQIMALVMPDRDPEQPDYIKNSKVLTLLLGKNDEVYWYEDLENARLDSTEFTAGGLRQVILDKMKRVQEKWGVESYHDAKTGAAKEGSFLYVLIKPAPDSRYRNLVDALDEMAICGVRYYSILDISEAETAFVHNPEAGLHFDETKQIKAMK